MSDKLTLAELEEQHVELLPARTVLSLFLSGSGQGSNGGTGGNGANATGGTGINIGPNINQSNSMGSVVGANGANANGHRWW